MFDFLLNDPVGHRVDVESDNITAEPVGLNEWSAAAHEGIGDLDPFQAVCLVKGLAQSLIEKFGKLQAAKQGSGSSSKPLVNRNNWPVVLLNLLFTQSKVCYERDVEILFYHTQAPSMAGYFLNGRTSQISGAVYRVRCICWLASLQRKRHLPHINNHFLSR